MKYISAAQFPVGHDYEEEQPLAAVTSQIVAISSDEEEELLVDTGLVDHHDCPIYRIQEALYRRPIGYLYDTFRDP